MRAFCLLAALISLMLIASPAARAQDAACPEPPGAPDSPEAEAVFEAATDCMLDAERAARGLRPLRRVPALDRAAEGHARDMVARGYFAHVSPEGQDVADRVRATGYLRGWPDWRLGEALAWGTGELAAPRSIVDALLASPPHRKILLRPTYRHVGIAVVVGAPQISVPAGTYALVLGRRNR
jgi:uncharacterized protein YkwD